MFVGELHECMKCFKVCHFVFSLMHALLSEERFLYQILYGYLGILLS